MITFDYFNKRTRRIETTSLPPDVFKRVLSDSIKSGIFTNVFNVR